MFPWKGDVIDTHVDVLKRLFIHDTAGCCNTGTNLVYMFYHSKTDKHISTAQNTEGNMHVLEAVHKSTYFLFQ
jgi:hypothetical protein